MALIVNTAEGGSNTTGVTAANSGGASGTAFAVDPTLNGGAITFSNEQPSHGSLGYKVVRSGTTQCYIDWTNTTASTLAFRGYFYFDNLPAGGTSFVSFRTSGGGTHRASLVVNNLGVVFITNTSETVVFTSGGTLSVDTLYRIEAVVQTPTTATGSMDLRIYAGDSTSPIANVSTVVTGANFGTDVGRIRIGANSAGNNWSQWYFDSIAWQDATTTFLGPVSTQLDTPVVTVTNETDPTTVGGSDGSVTVTWPAVSGAATYTAGKASGLNQTTGFTPTSTSATSPYTFTGLVAGDYTVAIKAVP